MKFFLGKNFKLHKPSCIVNDGQILDSYVISYNLICGVGLIVIDNRYYNYST